MSAFINCVTSKDFVCKQLKKTVNNRKNEVWNVEHFMHSTVAVAKGVGLSDADY